MSGFFRDIFCKKKTREYESNFKSIVFSEEEQFYMLFEEDYTNLKKQINKNITSEVLNNYITISLEEFKNRLKFKELFKKYVFLKNNKRDGIWIEQGNDDCYTLLFQDRGQIQWKNKNVTEDFIIDFYSKLILSLVEKYRSLNPI